MNFKIWIKAFRIRTLPLSLSCIAMGNFIAYYDGSFNWLIFLFSFITTIFLQILSNLANDYGDSKYGADNPERLGPERAVQGGLISSASMKLMIWIFAILSLASGLILLSISKLGDLSYFVFFILGVIAIIAAIGYTISVKKPYGYKGLGDISVFLFFGLLAVVGSYYLQTRTIDPYLLLPAATCGFFATGVLNINNIRDIESDKVAGKISVPVRIGLQNAVIYHGILLFGGFGLSIVYSLVNFESTYQFIYLVTLPLFYRNFQAVKNIGSSELLDPYLKQLSISILIFVMLFGLGLAYNSLNL
ncbi:MAG: 1,4-dihydroxy-2-naphthoate polyprenyltransferase [Deltaproteobacteria bacterium]